MLKTAMNQVTEGLYLFDGKYIINREDGWDLIGNIELDVLEDSYIQTRHGALGVYLVKKNNSIRYIIDESVEDKTIQIMSLSGLVRNTSIDNLLEFMDHLVKRVMVDRDNKVYLCTLLNDLIGIARIDKLLYKLKVVDYANTDAIGIVTGDTILRLYTGTNIIKGIGSYASHKLTVRMLDMCKLFIVEKEGVYSLVHIREEDIFILGLGDSVDVVCSMYNCIIMKLHNIKVIFIVLDGTLYYNTVDYIGKDTLQWNLIQGIGVSLSDSLLLNLDDVDVLNLGVKVTNIIYIKGISMKFNYLGSYNCMNLGSNQGTLYKDSTLSLSLEVF